MPKLEDVLNPNDPAEQSLADQYSNPYQVNPRFSNTAEQITSSYSMGPEWKVAALTDLFGLDQVESFNDSVESAKQSLDSIRQALSSASGLVELLTEFESAIEDPLVGLLDAALRYLQVIVDNFASSGVYVLDTWDYTALRDMGYDLRRRIQNNPGDFLNSYNFDFLSTNRQDNPVTDGNTGLFESASNKVADFGANQKNLWQGILGHKPVSYSEWIGIIADAFLDNNDVASKSEIELMNPDSWSKVVYKDTKLSDANLVNSNLTEEQIEQQRAKEQAQINAQSEDGVRSNAYRSGIKIENMIGKRTLTKVGRPKFTEGTASRVWIIGIQTPNFLSFITMLSQLLLLFGDMVNWEDDWRDLKESLDRIWDQGEGFIGDIDKDKFQEALNKMSVYNRNRLPAQGGDVPDFYGFNLGQLKLIRQIQNLINNARSSLNEGEQSSFAELVQAAQDMILNKINTLDQIVSGFDDVIDFIQAVLGISINYVEITSTLGNEDIAQQIRNLQGWPEYNNSPVFIWGMAFCAGVINSTSEAPEIIDIQNAQNRFKYDWNEVEQRSRERETGQPGQSKGMDIILGSFK